MTNSLTTEQHAILESMQTSRQFRAGAIIDQKQLFMLYNSECALGRPFSEKILNTLTDEQRFELLHINGEFCWGDNESRLYKFWATNALTGGDLGERLSPVLRNEIQNRLLCVCSRVERALDKSVDDNTYREVVEYIAKGFVGEVFCSVNRECFKLDQFFKDSVVREVTLGLQECKIDYSCKRLFKVCVLDALDELMCDEKSRLPPVFEMSSLDEFLATVNKLYDDNYPGGSCPVSEKIISNLATGVVARLVAMCGCTESGFRQFVGTCSAVWRDVLYEMKKYVGWHESFKDMVVRVLQDAIDDVVDEDDWAAKQTTPLQTTYDHKLLDEFFASIESLHDKDGSDSFTDMIVGNVATGYIASLVVKHGCTVAGCASFLTEMKNTTPVAEATIVAKTWHDTYKDTVFKALQDAIDGVVDENGRWKYVPFKRYHKPLQATGIANTAVERGDIEEAVCAAMPKLLAPDEEEETRLKFILTRVLREVNMAVMDYVLHEVTEDDFRKRVKKHTKELVRIVEAYRLETELTHEEMFRGNE